MLGSARQRSSSRDSAVCSSTRSSRGEWRAYHSTPRVKDSAIRIRTTPTSRIGSRLAGLVEWGRGHPLALEPGRELWPGDVYALATTPADWVPFQPSLSGLNSSS